MHSIQQLVIGRTLPRNIVCCDKELIFKCSLVSSDQDLYWHWPVGGEGVCLQFADKVDIEFRPGLRMSPPDLVYYTFQIEKLIDD